MAPELIFQPNLVTNLTIGAKSTVWCPSYSGAEVTRAEHRWARWRQFSMKRDLIQTKSSAPKSLLSYESKNKESFLKNKNHKMKLSAILIGAAVASDYDYDALGNKKCKFGFRDSA